MPWANLFKFEIFYWTKIKTYAMCICYVSMKHFIHEVLQIDILLISKWKWFKNVYLISF